MFDFIHKLIYLFVSLQQKLLRKKSGRGLKSVFTNASSKRVFVKGASLELTSKTEKAKQKLENDVKVILSKYSNNPEKILDFVQRSGTNVHKIKHADKILKLIGVETGLIGKTKGIKALCLNIILSVFTNEKVKLSFKTEPMFIIKTSMPDNYTTIQQFHKWYAMKLNLPGFDSESQDNLNKFLLNDKASVKNLSVDEILGLKDAIARDVEAINFVVNLAKSTSGSKKAFNKMVTDGASV